MIVLAGSSISSVGSPRRNDSVQPAAAGDLNSSRSACGAADSLRAGRRYGAHALGVRAPHRSGAEDERRVRGDWPPWWAWDLVFSNHALERMVQRDFNEIDVRTMLVAADRRNGVAARLGGSMRDTSLEVTYRRGRPFAAYYHLSSRAGQKSARTRRFEPGLVVDFARNGDPLGIEIIQPRAVTTAAMNRVLKELGLPSVKRGVLAPLRVAS
jgi:hypothetical protein